MPDARNLGNGLGEDLREQIARELDAELAAEEKRLADWCSDGDPWENPMLANYLGGIKIAAKVVRGIRDGVKVDPARRPSCGVPWEGCQ